MPSSARTASASATMSLARREARVVASISEGSALSMRVERPVPLHFSYERRPVHEVLTMLVDEREVPVYIVHFAQAAALERAQALASVTLTTRAQRDEIAKTVEGIRKHEMVVFEKHLTVTMSH